MLDHGEHMGNANQATYPKSPPIVFRPYFYALSDLIQVHVATTAVEVRVLSPAHEKMPSDALNSV